MSSTVTASPDVHGGKHKDDEASKLGMWLFLFSEILLFGGLFILRTGRNIPTSFTREDRTSMW